MLRKSLPDTKAKKKYVCLRFPNRLTIFSPTDSGFFIVRLKVFLLGDHIEKQMK